MATNILYRDQSIQEDGQAHQGGEHVSCSVGRHYGP